MPEKVISDSSPLINLFLIGKFTLLKEFYSCITIPGAVWKELVKDEKEGTDYFQRERTKGFIIVQNVASSPLLQLLHQELDEGEAEAVHLALATKADLLLVDEKEARTIARSYNLPITGVIGILLRAKLEKKITSLQKGLQALKEKGFRIHDDLYKRALKIAGEER